jgi:alpha-ketoglutarate-dependent taurine dioxygenase
MGYQRGAFLGQALERMRVEQIQRHIGARIYADRASLCDTEVVARCLNLLEERSVLIFPRLGLTDKEQRAFTDALGVQGDGSRIFPGGEAVENDVFEISLDTDSEQRQTYVKVSFFWHTDGLLWNAPVPKAAMLTACKVAPKGGQTEFASTAAAYEALPEREKSDLADLRVVHSPVASLRWILDSPADLDRATSNSGLDTKEHPIVWTQGTDRKSLVLSITADRIVGMPVPEGRALLSRLVEWTVQPEFRYRHEWEEGDLVLWNNHRTLHRVLPYDASSGRRMRRTSIQATRAA